MEDPCWRRVRKLLLCGLFRFVEDLLARALIWALVAVFGNSSNARRMVTSSLVKLIGFSRPEALSCVVVLPFPHFRPAQVVLDDHIA